MKLFFSKISFFVSVLVSLQAFAWGIIGHRTIAEIAERHLNQNTKRELKKIFGNESLAYWANWPDFIKSDSTEVWTHTHIWHYVNIDPQPDFDTFKKVLDEQSGPTAYTQIDALSKQIKNKNTSIENKKIAIIFLVHILGDLAQPMHTGRAEDLGGNKINVNFLGKDTNLHSIWDNDLIDSKKYSYTELASNLDTKDEKKIKNIQKGNIAEWLYETHLLANNIYANTPNGAKLSREYIYKYDKIVENQLLKGGLRLAKILNELFK